jgi:DNA-directed RNA polymerase subunit RPC12/RpoP
MYRCKECGRQFVLDPAKTAISDEKKKCNCPGTPASLTQTGVWQ